jgi:para-aminobenzoate synthetase component 1
MWSDRLSAARRQEIVAELQKVLPAPRDGAVSRTMQLGAGADPVEVAGTLRSTPGFLWLDGAASAGRILVDPLVRISASDGHAEVTGPGGHIAMDIGGFDLLEAALEAWGGLAGASLCGYLGYELGAALEQLSMPARHVTDLPDMVLGLYDFAYEYDADGWRILTTDAWRVEAAEARLPPSAPLPTGQCAPAGPVVSTPSDEGFQAAVERLVYRIHNGEVFQVDLCRRLEVSLDPAAIWPTYLRLRAASPASHGAFLHVGEGQAVLSISPELFLAVDNGAVRSCPIKGTRPRGGTAIEDRRLAEELIGSDKDRAELAMIVDVMRADLSRVCVPGSVEVASHARAMTLPTVHHLVSEVTGQLRDNSGTADLLRACFPAASISGAPKIRAIELAALEEGRLRGPCMGSIGWISLDGQMELSVAIRTAAASAGKIWYLAGCGITAESDPAAELAESEAKAAAFLKALHG